MVLDGTIYSGPPSANHFADSEGTGTFSSWTKSTIRPQTPEDIRKAVMIGESPTKEGRELNRTLSEVSPLSAAATGMLVVSKEVAELPGDQARRVELESPASTESILRTPTELFAEC